MATGYLSQACFHNTLLAFRNLPTLRYSELFLIYCFTGYHTCTHVHTMFRTSQYHWCFHAYQSISHVMINFWNQLNSLTQNWPAFSQYSRIVVLTIIKTIKCTLHLQQMNLFHKEQVFNHLKTFCLLLKKEFLVNLHEITKMCVINIYNAWSCAHANDERN